MRPALIAIALAITSTTAHATPAQDLNEGRTAFINRDCKNVERILNPLVFPEERLAQLNDLVETYIMLGSCLVDLGRTVEAKPRFEKALLLMPDRRLPENNPNYSAATLKVFEETRADVAARVKAMQDAKLLQAKLDEIDELKKTMVTVEDHPYILNFVPFGAGAFQNGNRVRGIIYASTQFVTLAASLGTWAYLVNTYGLTNKNVPLADGPFVRNLQILEIVSGAAFFVSYGASVFDALYHWTPRVRGEFDPELLTPEQQKLLEEIERRKQQRAKQSTSFRLSPMITPDGVGLGLSWEN